MAIIHHAYVYVGKIRYTFCYWQIPSSDDCEFHNVWFQIHIRKSNLISLIDTFSIRFIPIWIRIGEKTKHFNRILEKNFFLFTSILINRRNTEHRFAIELIAKKSEQNNKHWTNVNNFRKNLGLYNNNNKKKLKTNEISQNNHYSFNLITNNSTKCFLSFQYWNNGAL